MKIAILSDIHGNYPALEATAAHIEAWKPDGVIVNGDIVNRGPKSLACWRWIEAKMESKGWQTTRGNHEDYVLKHGNGLPDAAHLGVRAEINKSSHWTYDQLGAEAKKLADLPDYVEITAPNGRLLYATHASRRGNSDGIFPALSDRVVREQIAPSPDLFVTSHIHFANKRRVDDTLVINTGSAGSHCYDDTRASYVQAEWRGGEWQAEIVRLSYDMAQTERDYRDSDFLTEAGATAHLLFHEWRTAVVLLPVWRANYEQAVIAGEIELETAVFKLLREYGMVR